MKKLKPLWIPKELRKFGLKVDCAKCDTLVYDVCRRSGLPLIACEFPECHSFKVIAYEKDTGVRRTINLLTRSVKNAQIEAAIFQKKIKDACENNSEAMPLIPTGPTVRDSILLTEALAKRVAFLRGENVPDHEKRIRSEKWCRQVEKIYLQFISCLGKDHNVKELTADQVDKYMVGKFHSHILSQGYEPRTYNMMMTAMKSLYLYLNQEGWAKTNPFANVPVRPERRNITVFNKEEYDAMLDITRDEESGFRKVGKETKQYFRKWVNPAIKFGLMGGRRIEEILQAKDTDIRFDENGEMTAIEVTDFKVSRQFGRLEDNPKKVLVPVTRELRDFLHENGITPSTIRSRYIIGDDETMSRETMKKFLSRSFSHYWSLLPYSKHKKASFKTLRKTYYSALAAAIGISNASVISQHSGARVLQDHYVSKEIINSTARNFSVFSSDGKRMKELHKLRKFQRELTLSK